MNKFLKKVQTKVGQKLADLPGFDQTSLVPNVSIAIPYYPTLQPPSLKLIYLLRKQRGVNLGSWFTLENWLTPSLFTHAAHSKSSEMDILQGMSSDLSQAKSMLNQHWANFVNEGDWEWMVSHGINTVRIPISYYHFLPSHPDPAIRGLISSTEYAGYESVYADAWGYIVNAIETAHKHSIGVLIDLHAAPGAQNNDAHSGLSGGHAGLWDSGDKQQLTVSILVALAKEIVRFPNVVGLEVLNEPKNTDMLQGFYDTVINAIAQAGISTMDLPLYISDSWDIRWYCQYIDKKANEGKFLVLDHHLYRCFTQSDHSKSAHQHARDVHPNSNPSGGSLSMLSNAASKTGSALVIGEWSAALNPASLDQYGSHEEKRAAQAEWGHSQWEAYEMYCGGYFFWTLKKEGAPDRGWCFYSAVEQGVLPAFVDRMKEAFHRNPRELDALRAQGVVERQEAFHAHANWWDQNSSAEDRRKFEHWRFEDGYVSGWDDALAFWFGDLGEDLGGELGGSVLGGSELGFIRWWKKVRAEGHKVEKGPGGGKGMVWEFEHGYDQAVRRFREVVKHS
ncbi:hypothetical protein D9758_005521 [Tetrapyrgos nigripes]|uniref:Glycoside hydrolase family 5 domain-containing protein n=1 Tax=Tetrapyrgos nigripes TaxID=182062 RepID=A0A8H5GGX6_9AGAR|nr:hypothetical protein D9758_005521 [Tetrapyrgos nigripes]